MGRRNSESGRMAVSWLATSFVIVIGTAAAAFVIIAGTDQIQWPLVVWGFSISGLVVILLLLSARWDRPMSRLQTWLLAQNRNNPTDDYRVARRSIRIREEMGNNQPPTVESVRDAADQGGAWVPRSTPRSQNKTR